MHCRRQCLVNFHRKQQCKSHKATPHFFNCSAKLFRSDAPHSHAHTRGGKLYNWNVAYLQLSLCTKEDMSLRSTVWRERPRRRLYAGVCESGAARHARSSSRHLVVPDALPPPSGRRGAGGMTTGTVHSEARCPKATWCCHLRLGLAAHSTPAAGSPCASSPLSSTAQFPVA